MSDRKTSSTPIIVGAVIAILGILTGLYIATNAREQMQEQNAAESQASAAAGETPTEVEEKQETTTDETLPDVPDDFEPVSAEEIEQALPEQKEQPEETQPTQE